ncbi:hypothetical protein SAMN05216354_0387 [Xylanibacter ruminicola]|uniref:Helix-turn-helix n=1 Tax=Xylanibacter ruminicola TaxID=839 RepID=A0A1H5RZC6_XYLRU|nr:XRE family transcriptional regulator [Xylanibacter ruminicola]SEF42871.1 hypothetical protein SAMN05216354_0387 [Xylanibacter ruminicola]
MDQLKSVNDRIKYMIEHEGHTVSSFARKCGVADSTIRSYMTEGRKPNYDLIVTMIKAINQPWCDANWLVMGGQSASENQDAKKLLKIVAEQQRTIEEQRKRIDALTDKLLEDK